MLLIDDCFDDKEKIVEDGIAFICNAFQIRKVNVFSHHNDHNDHNHNHNELSMHKTLKILLLLNFYKI